ncbi:MAG TPA: UPF0158 family protein, partial [Spirochaetia bacterium]|nr:UPF0158 family protein [Spirochaetia bacterium]
AESEEERYIPLPEWRSVDGYNLMEKFVASLHNPIYREILRSILASGKGVFRQFKDALKERKEIERLWYHFKEREMRTRVVEWYNLLRESWGLSRIGDPGDDDTDSLVLIDFTIDTADSAGRVSIASDANSVELPRSAILADVVTHFDELGYRECIAERSAYLAQFLIDKRRSTLPAASAQSGRILVALTPVEELAGFLWADLEPAPDQRAVATILQIYVLPEYRGLGLARALFTRFCHLAYEQKVEALFVALPGSASFLSGMFGAQGAEPLSLFLQLDLTAWYRENVEVAG